MISVASHYFELCKPKVVYLIVFTAVVGMFLAVPTWPPLNALVAGTLGIGLAAASAAAINHLLDQRIDAVMARTRNRPLPSGLLGERQVLCFALILCAVSMILLVVWVNPLTAMLTFFSLIGYAIIYTVWLKRATPQNIVIGGAAGAMPPLVGWAAVTGGLGWPALVLFGIVFLWTPPPFWALALRYRADYARAGVPMLPVVKGEAETRRQSLIYSGLLVACTLALVPVAGMGLLYLGAALVLGGGFFGLALRSWRWPTVQATRALFLYSIPYLGLLFVAMGFDQTLPW